MKRPLSDKAPACGAAGARDDNSRRGVRGGSRLLSRNMWRRAWPRWWLCENLAGHFPGDIGEAEVAASVAIGEGGVFESHQGQQCRVQVGGVHSP